MPRCPNCSYILVLLEKRGKYKCAKCGKLFLKKEIEDEEFREWNITQRGEDKETLKPKKRVKLTEEEKKQRTKESSRKYYDKNIKKMRAYDRSRIRDRGEYNKKLYHLDVDKSRLDKRIVYWRQMQKGLLDSIF